MKHNFKLKERLGALLLAMLFILQAILGLVPVCVTQAAPLTVETWDSDKVVEYGYRFNMKFQPGITTYESFGCDNLDREAFSDNGKSERDTECVRVGADYKAGSAGMRYNNVGLQFCEWMIEEVGVAAVPGSSFFREPINHLIRLHFARSEDSLREAIDRLGKLSAYLQMD